MWARDSCFSSVNLSRTIRRIPFHPFVSDETHTHAHTFGRTHQINIEFVLNRRPYRNAVAFWISDAMWKRLNNRHKFVEKKKSNPKKAKHEFQVEIEKNYGVADQIEYEFYSIHKFTTTNGTQRNKNETKWIHVNTNTHPQTVISGATAKTKYEKNKTK